MIKYLNYVKENREGEVLIDEHIPIRVSYLALEAFKREHGIAFDHVDPNNFEIHYYRTLMFHSIKAGFLAIDEPMKVGGKELKKEEDVDVILDATLWVYIDMVQTFFDEDPNLKKLVGGQKKRLKQSKS